MSAPTPTLEMLLDKQQAMTGLAATLIGESNTDRIQQVAAELQTRAAELDAMARALAAAHEAPEVRGLTRVQLTPGQVERIQQKTGIVLETLNIPDAAGTSAQTMPMTDPRTIEALALAEAERLRNGRTASIELQSEMERAFADLEAVGNPQLIEALERMKADPAIFGGILKK